MFAMREALDKHLSKNWGEASRIANELEISRAAVSQWKMVPANRVLKVAELTGIPRGKLRPDLYPGEA
jgi:DNA-binding transcriptional regulator YdaS (Cro superfamily)